MQIKCTSCGANIKGFEGKQEITCDYCGTLNKILRPKEVIVSNASLTPDNTEKLKFAFENYFKAFHELKVLVVRQKNQLKNWQMVVRDFM